MGKRFTRIVKLVLICVLAAGANYLLNTLSVYIIKIPLFLDTVFNAAVCFTVGIIPGIATALLTYAATSIRNGSFDPFILCAIAEVLIIWRLKPAEYPKPAATLTSLVSVFARLMLLYITCCITISILGGVIDYFYYGVLLNPKQYFSAEDTFKIGLLQSGIPILTLNILSRIPVNLVDRFIVISGGYFISCGLKRFFR